MARPWRVFAFRLCKVLGVSHPRHLPLTAEEFIEWEAYASIEPWGTDADNVRTAALQATVANFSGNSKRAWKVTDFLPKQPEVEAPVEDKIKKHFHFGKW